MAPKENKAKRNPVNLEFYLEKLLFYNGSEINALEDTPHDERVQCQQTCFEGDVTGSPSSRRTQQRNKESTPTRTSGRATVWATYVINHVVS